jgi:uroporphyrinogen III methyltransferase/synthase
VPPEYVAEAILPGLGNVQGQRILLPRADIARKTLVDELKAQGAYPDEVAVYCTQPTEPDRQTLAELEGGIDIATFTSSSTVRNFFEILGERAAGTLTGARIACIGPITAATAREYGLEVDVVADTYTIDGLVEALLKPNKSI